jgi:hypothetical protein
MEVTAEKIGTPCSHMTSNQNSDQSSKLKFELFSEGCQLFSTGCSILGGELMFTVLLRRARRQLLLHFLARILFLRSLSSQLFLEDDSAIPSGRTSKLLCGSMAEFLNCLC